MRNSICLKCVQWAYMLLSNIIKIILRDDIKLRINNVLNLIDTRRQADVNYVIKHEILTF